MEIVYQVVLLVIGFVMLIKVRIGLWKVPVR